MSSSQNHRCALCWDGFILVLGVPPDGNAGNAGNAAGSVESISRELGCTNGPACGRNLDDEGPVLDDRQGSAIVENLIVEGEPVIRPCTTRQWLLP